MADHSKPVLTSTYANFVTELDARFDDLAVGLDPAFSAPTNLLNNSIRWSSASNKWEKLNLTVWSPLSTGYDIDIANGSILNSPISGSTGSFTTLTASGAFSLTGDQVQVSEGGTGATTAATARANLGAAPTASPVFTGPVSVNDGVGEGQILVGANDGYFYANATQAGWYSPTLGTFHYNFADDQLYINSQKAWNQGNDGAGSGLDADLLDGQQGSYYAPTANPTFSGMARSDSSRATLSWTGAQFMAYSTTGAAVDFASTAYHVQDASDAPQWGFNFGDSNRFGLYNSAGTTRLFTLPATGIGSGLLKIISGDVTIAAADADYATPAYVVNAFAGGAHFYTGTDPANLTFPVGAFVLVSGTPGVNRNESAAVYINPITGAYRFTVNGTALTGTWRFRGYDTQASLMQRTA